MLPFAKVCWFRSTLTTVAGAQSGFGEWNVWWLTGMICFGNRYKGGFQACGSLS